MIEKTASPHVKSTENLFAPADPDPSAVAKAKLDAGVRLICHEDSLNWSKFNNLLYATIGFLAAYGLVAKDLPANPDTFRRLCLTAIAAAGSLLSLGFFWQLQSGIRCLEQHKDFTKRVDRTMNSIGLPCIFELPAYDPRNRPSRMLLRAAPLGLFALWLLLAAAPYLL